MLTAPRRGIGDAQRLTQLGAGSLSVAAVLARSLVTPVLQTARGNGSTALVNASPMAAARAEADTAGV